MCESCDGADNQSMFLHLTTYGLLSSKLGANGLWANNLSLFDDDKTYGVITNILGKDFK